MVTNQDAATIAEKDAKQFAYHTIDLKQPRYYYVLPEGVTGDVHQYGIRVENTDLCVTFYGLEDCDAYVKANQYQYYVCITTWLLLIKAHNPIGADIVEDRIRKDGLLATIDSASKAALKLIGGEAPEVFWSTVIRGLSTADALEVLRFAKRFSVKSHVLEIQQESDFLQTNRRIGEVNRSLTYSHVIKCVKEELAEILKGYVSPDYTARFTNGVSAEGCKLLHEKIEEWAKQSIDYGDPAYSAVSPNVVDLCRRVSLVSKFRSVPKSYKTYRGIAMEPLQLQSRQQAIRGALETALHKNAGSNTDIHNQGLNGTLASDQSLATIDLSAASDSLSLQLMRYILPYDVWRDMESARCMYSELPSGKTVFLQMFCTMGNGFTFALEDSVFLAIARAAVRMYQLFSGSEIDLVSRVYVYGDDLEVPAETFETVVDFLSMLGFVVNTDKSYATGPFRESCGYDWYDDMPVTSLYWPRKYIYQDINYMPHLVSLQNRLAERGGLYYYWEAVRFLRKQVQRVVPSIGCVSIEEMLDYNLQGKCLVDAVSTVTTKPYRRDYGLKPGDGLYYHEDRYYVNALVPNTHDAYLELGHKPEGRYIWPGDYMYDGYLYMEFLREGPLVLDQLTENLVVTDSRLGAHLTKYSDGFRITRVRLL